ncbi:hypothetical protein [Halovenus salina]|uniref:Uncharacterized protein n=1 Tax=Halovenus salina TaxID=1510225 RepID=A0ABD5W6I2_9EURY
MVNPLLDDVEPLGRVEGERAQHLGNPGVGVSLDIVLNLCCRRVGMYVLVHFPLTPVVGAGGTEA